MITAVTAAHGRVNLIGEHTDYNEGFVLPTAIPQAVRVEAVARADGRMVVRSREAGEAAYELGREAPAGSWIDYVQGVTSALAARGHVLTGASIDVESDVPMGAGLASSAAFAIAILKALRALGTLEVEDLELARMAQAAEHEFAGARVGLMDPLAALFCREDFALLVDTRALTTRQVPLLEDTELVVIDSGVRHRHAGGEYNTRREECAAACAELGVSSLRDVPDDWATRLSPRLLKRVRHVVSENRRVLDAVRALEAGDARTLGKLLLASHVSLRDDYEVSIPELDRLVETGAADTSVFGGRMTGGGFGGSVPLLARRGEGAAVAQRVVAAAGGPGARVLLPV
jgi:galactokinase